MARIDREILKAAVRGHAKRLCNHYFPNGKKVRGQWVIGNVSGDPGQSLKIELEGEKAGVYHDFATGEGGDFIELAQRMTGRPFVEIAHEIGSITGVNVEEPTTQYRSGKGSRYRTKGTPPLCDWDRDYKLSTQDVEDLGQWRRLSASFCQWAASNSYIGRRNGLWAFPVYNNGSIVSAHIRHNKNKWEFLPRLKDLGLCITPLVLGDLSSAEKVFSDESQWDLFSILDKLGVQHGEHIAGICTRGAQNGSLIAQITITAELYLIPQNDEPGRAWLEHAAEVLTQAAKIITVPSAYHDADDWLKALGDITEFIEAIRNAQIRTPKSPRLYIEFHKPSYFINYEPPTDLVLAGDNHIVRGSVFVIGGAPGVGKSRASVSLAIAGALRTPWFALEVLTEFRTMIIQAENGRFRLKLDLIEEIVETRGRKKLLQQ